MDIICEVLNAEGVSIGQIHGGVAVRAVLIDREDQRIKVWEPVPMAPAGTHSGYEKAYGQALLGARGY